MGQRIINRLLDGLKKAAAGLANKRKASNGRKYGIQDFPLSAFVVFYFQYPSMLNFQETMEKERKRIIRGRCSGLKRYREWIKAWTENIDMSNYTTRKKINHEGASNRRFVGARKIQQARILPAFFDFRAFAEVAPGAKFLDKNLSNGVRRLMGSSLTEDEKAELSARRALLNPVELQYNLNRCQQVKDSYSAKKGVGVAENPRSGVGARGSSVKKRGVYGKICSALPSIALPLLKLLTTFWLSTRLKPHFRNVLPKRFRLHFEMSNHGCRILPIYQ
jgi:hypothetical protein